MQMLNEMGVQKVVLIAREFNLSQEEVEQHFDLVTIDTTPVLAVTHVAAVGKQVVATRMIIGFRENIQGNRTRPAVTEAHRCDHEKRHPALSKNISRFP